MCQYFQKTLYLISLRSDYFLRSSVKFNKMFLTHSFSICRVLRVDNEECQVIKVVMGTTAMPQKLAPDAT